MTSQTTSRGDLRTEIRDNIQEASGVSGAIFTDALINRHITREIRSLPRKNIYLEESWTQTLNTTDDYTIGIVLPEGTEKVELVERDEGNTTTSHWTTINGYDFYGGNLFLPYTVSTAFDLRVKIKKGFTIPTDDSTDLDVPDDMCEVVVWGVTIRLYKILMGYLRGSQSWDSVTKPGDLQMTVVQNWIREARDEYQELIKLYSFSPRPRDISLVD